VESVANGNSITAGITGDLWWPHIYEPTETPLIRAPQTLGRNPVGRWDYGPWSWPPVPAAKALPGATPSIPTENYLTSCVPESFVDTPVVNGTAYPYLVVDPKAYRFRILNACNDRTLNLQLYMADPSNKKEVVMIPALDYSDPAFASIYPNTPGFPVLPYPALTSGRRITGMAACRIGTGRVPVGSRSAPKAASSRRRRLSPPSRSAMTA